MRVCVQARKLRVGDVLVTPKEGEVQEVYWPPIPNCVAVGVKDPPEDPPQYRLFSPRQQVTVER